MDLSAKFFYYGALLVLGIASFIVGKIFGPVFLWIASKVIAKTKSTLDDKIFEEIRGPVESFFFLFVFYFAVHIISFFESSIPIVEYYTVAAIFLLLTFLALKIAKAFFHWYFEEGHRTSKIKIELSLLPLLQKSAQIIIALIGLTIILGELGYPITGILAVSSVVGIVLGLASQETLANIFAGMALQLDRVYHYGDYLKLPNGEIAKLRKIGMRSSKLHDLSGKTIVVSNSEFAKLRTTKVGNSGSLKIGIEFEAPLSVKIESIVDAVQAKLSNERIEIVLDSKQITGTRGKVKVPGWYEGKINIPVKESQDYTIIFDKVNETLIELIGKEIK